MRFRLGMMMGFCAGYVMGAKAGRVRYDQIKKTAGQFWESEKGQKIRDEVQKAVDQGRTQAAQAIDSMRGHRTIKLEGDELNERVAPFVQGAHVEDGGTLANRGDGQTGNRTTRMDTRTTEDSRTTQAGNLKTKA